jgi:hypothetical protein
MVWAEELALLLRAQVNILHGAGVLEGWAIHLKVAVLRHGLTEEAILLTWAGHQVFLGLVWVVLQVNKVSVCAHWRLELLGHGVVCFLNQSFGILAAVVILVARGDGIKRHRLVLNLKLVHVWTLGLNRVQGLSDSECLYVLIIERRNRWFQSKLLVLARIADGLSCILVTVKLIALSLGFFVRLVQNTGLCSRLDLFLVSLGFGAFFLFLVPLLKIHLLESHCRELLLHLLSSGVVNSWYDVELLVALKWHVKRIRFLLIFVLDLAEFLGLLFWFLLSRVKRNKYISRLFPKEGVVKKSFLLPKVWAFLSQLVLSELSSLLLHQLEIIITDHALPL